MKSIKRLLKGIWDFITLGWLLLSIFLKWIEDTLVSKKDFIQVLAAIILGVSGYIVSKNSLEVANAQLEIHKAELKPVFRFETAEREDLFSVKVFCENGFVKNFYCEPISYLSFVKTKFGKTWKTDSLSTAHFRSLDFYDSTNETHNIRGELITVTSKRGQRLVTKFRNEYPFEMLSRDTMKFFPIQFLKIGYTDLADKSQEEYYAYLYPFVIWKKTDEKEYRDMLQANNAIYVNSVELKDITDSTLYTIFK